MHTPTRLLNTVLPRYCDLCGQQAFVMLCTDCESDLPWLRSGCRVCALPFQHEPEAPFDICGECQQNPCSFEKVVVPFIYKSEIAWLLNRFKHNNHLHYGEYMLKFLSDKVRHSYAHEAYPQLITSAPLHWTRTLFRGFNQAEILARSMSSKLQIPYHSAVKKVKRTPSQQGLSKNSRAKNLRHAFVVKRDVSNLHIAIVDDVVTTAATAEVLSRQLMNAGAKRVDIWALARTPK